MPLARRCGRGCAAGSESPPFAVGRAGGRGGGPARERRLLLRAPVAPLLTRLPAPCKVGLASLPVRGVLPHQRQYFLNSTRSGEFRLDFFV